MKKIRVGIIGVGQIAKDRHIPYFLKNKNVNLVALCDLNPSAFKNYPKTKYKYYKYYQEMLQNEDLDLVDISTPPFHHFQQSMDCLEAGCHILVEKPFTFTLKECSKILKYATLKKKKVGVFHTGLFFPVMMNIQDHSEELGDLQKITINYNVSLKNHVYCNDWIEKMPFGALDEQLPHVAYIINNFMKVKKAKAITDYPIYYSILLYGNCLASINLFYGKDWAFDIELLGSKKKMFIDLLHQHYIISDLREDISKYSILFHALRSINARLKSILRNIYNLNKSFGHEYIIESFINSLINDVDPPMTFQDISNVVRITELINHACHKKSIKKLYRLSLE